MKKAKLDKVLRALMKARGVKASDLSKSTGVPAATLSSLLNGGQTQKPEHLLALSQYFKVSIEFLLFGDQNLMKSLSVMNTHQKAKGLVENFVTGAKSGQNAKT